jgi:ABC-type Fe3+/spermidine/putrescine transport system ATPase subunit
VSLSIRGLSVSYAAKQSTTPAIRGVTLDIGTAERFAVMGPSGSGKSTLLRAIAGLVRIDSGTIVIDGHDMTNTPAHLRSVGFMFQDYALFPHMSVMENVGYGPRMAGISEGKRNDRSRNLLGLVGLDGFADRNPATLSGGEQQRVALARTLAAEPSVVLLDEPLGSLDISLRESLLAETRSILDSVGATSMYVTHDSAEAFAFCDRMAIIHDGEILRIGTPAEIWHDPRSEFAARAIGQSNLIPLSFLEPSRTGVGFVPLDAVTVIPSGRFSGVVIATRFEHGGNIATVDLAGATSSLEIRMHRDARLGSALRFNIQENEVIVVSVDEV